MNFKKLKWYVKNEIQSWELISSQMLLIKFTLLSDH